MFSTEQKFCINGDNNEALAKVLQLALELSGTNGIKAFYEDTNGLVLCKYDSSGTIEYPFEPTIPVLVEQVNQYIKKLTNDDIQRLAGKEPDIDGTVRLGWEIFHPLWYGEHKLNDYKPAAIIAVKPCWIIYHK